MRVVVLALYCFVDEKFILVSSFTCENKFKQMKIKKQIILFLMEIKTAQK